MTKPSYKPEALARRVKQHVRGKPQRFFAVCHPGFETVSRRELEELGIKDILEVTTGGILFKGKTDDCYRANLMSRTMTRVLMRISSFNVLNFSTLQDIIADIPWELYLKEDSRLSFSITARKSRLYHTDRIEEEIRTGIESRLTGFGFERKKTSSGPLQQVFVRLYRDRCTVSLDSSGELLYRRGRRILINEAPLRETRAAAILRAAQYEKYNTIIDPMCGSGIFSLEAAAMARGDVAGIDRSFAFEEWPVFSPAAFANMKKKLREGNGEEKKLPLFFASDIDEKSLATARENFRRAGLENTVSLCKRDFFKEEEPLDFELPALILLNPPYGKRMATGKIEEFYKNIGKTLGEKYASCGWALIVPGDEAEAALGRSHDHRVVFKQGGIPVALLVSEGF